jgi:hypothetical protein
MSGSNGVTVFVCGKKDDKLKCSTLGCKNFSSTSCTYVLSGKRAGDVCGHALCTGCDSDGLCPPHKRLMDQRAAAGRG